MDKLGLIILAGGLSSRMGQPKALLPWVNGESLISHALRKGLEADVDDIIISIGDDDQLDMPFRLISLIRYRTMRRKSFYCSGFC